MTTEPPHTWRSEQGLYNAGTLSTRVVIIQCRTCYVTFPPDFTCFFEEREILFCKGWRGVMFVIVEILNNYERVKEEIDLHIRTNRILHLLILVICGFTNMRFSLYLEEHVGEGPRFKVFLTS